MLIEFSMHDIFGDYLWCLSSMVQFYQGTFCLTGFHLYHYYFLIEYNCCYKGYLLLLLFYNLLRVRKGFISNYFLIDCVAFLFQSKKISYIFNFVIFRLLFIFSFLVFFHPHAHCWHYFKKSIILSLTSTTVFLWTWNYN